MASLPPIRKLYLEDYATQKSWIGPLIIILNTFMNAVVSALTKNLTLVDNSTSDIKYMVLNAVPTLTAPTSVSWTKSISPVAVIVGNTQLSGSTFNLSAAVQVQWQMNATGTALQVTNVVGITPTQTNQYTLTLICIAG